MRERSEKGNKIGEGSPPHASSLSRVECAPDWMQGRSRQRLRVIISRGFFLFSPPPPSLHSDQSDEKEPTSNLASSLCWCGGGGGTILCGLPTTTTGYVGNGVMVLCLKKKPKYEDRAEKNTRSALLFRIKKLFDFPTASLFSAFSPEIAFEIIYGKLLNVLPVERTELFSLLSIYRQVAHSLAAKGEREKKFRQLHYLVQRRPGLVQNCFSFSFYL